MENGTGGALRARGYAGPSRKDRNKNEARDAWFVGYTPEIVAAVWVGFDDGGARAQRRARRAYDLGRY